MNMPLVLLNLRRRAGVLVTYSNFIPSGSDSLITADSLTFKVVSVAVPEGTWAFEGSTIMESPTPPDAADYRIVGTTVEAV
jgi:hypothetical protein